MGGRSYVGMWQLLSGINISTKNEKIGSFNLLKRINFIKFAVK